MKKYLISFTFDDGFEKSGRNLAAMFEEDRARVRAHGRRAGSALRVHEALKARPLVTLQDAGKRAALSFPASAAGMALLSELGIIRELTGKKRNRVFAYSRYLSILDEGTEAR